jgi:hypothetical protein
VYGAYLLGTIGRKSEKKWILELQPHTMQRTKSSVVFAKQGQGSLMTFCKRNMIFSGNIYCVQNPWNTTSTIAWYNCRHQVFSCIPDTGCLVFRRERMGS